jgi:uncharacterized flavoprotein (TIGR03862 family)
MKVALFGGGPASLMAAYQLGEKHEVHIFEKGKRVGRKFLVAGNGGFNLTNQAKGEELMAVYSNHPKLHQALLDFSTNDTRNWLSQLGIETFIGSSGRVFPEKGIKPTQVLQKIMDALEERNVQVHLDHSFIGFDQAKKPIVSDNENEITIEADHYIFGLGGGSWSKTGANSDWFKHFNAINVQTLPFQASNCGVDVDWGDEFQKKFAGTPLKNIAVQAYGESCKGEAIITEYGLEGNAIYPLVPAIRDTLAKKERAYMFIDFKPNSTVEMLQSKITSAALKPKNYTYTFNISKAVHAIAKRNLNKETYLNPKAFAASLKEVLVPVIGLRSVEEAISTVGGISMDEVDEHFRLIKHPNISIVGEMLDWDAPTGGFLLQGCFSTGFKVGQFLNQSLS